MLSFSALLVGDNSETNRLEQIRSDNFHSKFIWTKGGKKVKIVFFSSYITKFNVVFFYNGNKKYCEKILTRRRQTLHSQPFDTIIQFT